MKKVGIMTLYHHTYNYGAQLQAFALQKTISNLGYECEVISFDWMNEQTKQHYRNTSKSNQEKFIEFASKIPHSDKLYNAANIFEANDEYDTFVCGSDQIWGCKNSIPIHNLPHFALGFADENKTKIAYAASMGGSFITERYRAAIKNPVGKLNAVSVREQSAVPFLQNMTSDKVQSVLDPTLLLSLDEWNKTLSLKQNNEDYIFVYGFNGNQNLSKAIEILNDKLKCPVKTISYDANDTAGPIEFLNLILSAKYVITDSYHGTIFSILFNKPFLSFAVDKIHSGYSKSTRITDLLAKLNLMERYVSYEDNVEDIIKSDFIIDYEKVNQIISKEKSKSMDFLSNALKIKNNIKYDIVSSKDCYSCGACKAACPHNCIDLVENSLGFLKPKINRDICTDCGKCVNVCPSINSMKSNSSKDRVLAVMHNNKKERLASASAGVFYGVATKILAKGGVVFGAAYDSDWSVHHISTDTIEGLEKLRSSKYLLSNTANTYKEAEDLLKRNIPVLYSGTACQIAGLKSFLGKEYDNLYTADLICHGVPSPKLWSKYIDHHKEKNGDIDYINMRGKHLGYLDENGRSNVAYQITHTNSKEKIEYFLDDLYFQICFSFCMDRCYNCQFKDKNFHADITMGDLWGVKRWREDIYDGTGNSLVIAHTEKGNKLLEDSDFTLIPAVKYDLDKSNYTLLRSSRRDPMDGYLRAIYEESSIERLFYECRGVWESINQDNLIRQINGQVEQRVLLAQLVKFQSMGLSLEHDPTLKGKIIIYGAAMAGKLAFDCMDEKRLCFVDKFTSETSYGGYPICKLGDEMLNKLIEENEQVTFLITPTWDIDNIINEIRAHYPAVSNIVSISKVVEKIWI